MRLYMNFHEVRGPYGGANAFLRALRDGLAERGVRVANDPDARVDLAFLNALTDGIDLDFVRAFAERGVPIVHRKVGYRVSGSPEMRSMVDSVVRGDRLQIEFSPYLAHTVFQSEYSRDVFVSSGFEGPYAVIHNGVDERVFTSSDRSLHGRLRRGQPAWDGQGTLRLVISTWSADENKGFPEYREIDTALNGRRDVAITLVGRVPAGTTFRRIRVLRPRRPRALASVLRAHDALLQLARYETCSNALTEGINCGLPAIYLDSGANDEIAADYGVPYRGDLFEAVDRLRPRYRELVSRTPGNPYRMGIVGDRYLELFERVLEESR